MIYSSTSTEKFLAGFYCYVPFPNCVFCCEITSIYVLLVSFYLDIFKSAEEWKLKIKLRTLESYLGEHSEVSQARSLHARVLNKNAVSWKTRNNRKLPKHKLSQNAKNLQCLLKFGLIEDDVTVFQWPWNSESG